MLMNWRPVQSMSQTRLLVAGWSFVGVSRKRWPENAEGGGNVLFHDQGFPAGQPEIRQRQQPRHRSEAAKLFSTYLNHLGTTTEALE